MIMARLKKYLIKRFNKKYAGVFNKEKNVLGMMPHPERMIDQSLSGRWFFIL